MGQMRKLPAAVPPKTLGRGHQAPDIGGAIIHLGLRRAELGPRQSEFGAQLGYTTAELGVEQAEYRRCDPEFGVATGHLAPEFGARILARPRNGPS